MLRAVLKAERVRCYCLLNFHLSEVNLKLINPSAVKLPADDLSCLWAVICSLNFPVAPASIALEQCFSAGIPRQSAFFTLELVS